MTRPAVLKVLLPSGLTDLGSAGERCSGTEPEEQHHRSQ
jgi:hypothetical protein